MRVVDARRAAIALRLSQHPGGHIDANDSAESARQRQHQPPDAAAEIETWRLPVDRSEVLLQRRERAGHVPLSTLEKAGVRGGIQPIRSVPLVAHDTVIRIPLSQALPVSVGTLHRVLLGVAP
jgi:hypothetical protein